ncbi:MAG: hypothetical protein MHM6MM_009077 [Cercozoa sp. M6MM]
MDRRPVSKRTVQQILSVSDVALSRTTRVRKSVSKHVPRALSVGDAGGSGSGSGSGTSVGGVASAAASVVASVSSNSVCSSVCSNANTVGSVTGSSDVAMPPMLMNLGLPTPTLPVHLASSSLPGAGAVPAVPGMPATHLLGKSASVPQWQRQPSQPPLPQQQQQQQQQQLTTQQIQAAPQQQARFLSHMPPSVTRTGSHLRVGTHPSPAFTNTMMPPPQFVQHMPQPLLQGMPPMPGHGLPGHNMPPGTVQLPVTAPRGAPGNMQQLGMPQFAPTAGGPTGAPPPAPPARSNSR